MSKVSRQTSKQNRSANKQNTGQATKQDQATSNGTTGQATKGSQPASKQTTSQTSKQVQPGNKQQTAKQVASPSKQMTRQAVKYERRQEERRQREEARRRAVQRKRITIGSIVAVAVLVIGVVGYFIYTGYVQPNNSPAATPAPINPSYPAIDGVSCDSLEQTANHYHAHLSIYINGQQAKMPAQVGIAPDGSCYYWMHTHTADGVLHIEAPAKRTFTLGNFFDIWGQKFSTLQFPPELDQPGGPGWQVWINGKVYNGDFHNIVLQPHMLITLAYNTPGVTPDTSYNWGGL